MLTHAFICICVVDAQQKARTAGLYFFPSATPKKKLYTHMKKCAARRFFRGGCTYYSASPVAAVCTPQTECCENFLPSADFSKFNYIYCSGCMSHARRTNYCAQHRREE